MGKDSKAKGGSSGGSKGKKPASDGDADGASKGKGKGSKGGAAEELRTCTYVKGTSISFSFLLLLILNSTTPCSLEPVLPPKENERKENMAQLTYRDSVLEFGSESERERTKRMIFFFVWSI